jgi:prepilin-type N-terminal cleavage/methylation domain-containing protein
MKMNQIRPHTKHAASRGFTLVEMLVVAALIAIFAGLAVFNITAQLEREKSKASIAEARNIATAMSFAYDDLGFFPKIGLLKYNLDNVFQFLKGTGFDSAEYHSYVVGNQDVRMRKMWRQNYMAGSGPDKTVKMHYMSNGKEMILDWPADPWGNPYVGYFIKTIPATSPSAEPTQKFIQKAGEKANYAAAIVSYGRNRVPGMKDSPPDPSQRFTWRLYGDHAEGPRHFWLAQGDTAAPGGNLTGHAYNEYNPNVRLQAFTDPSPQALTDPAYQPYMKDRGSDDRYYEF